VRRARSSIADPHRGREHLGSNSRAAPDEHPGSGAGPRRAKTRRVPPSAEAGDASAFGARPARCSARARIHARSPRGIRARPSPSDGCGIAAHGRSARHLRLAPAPAARWCSGHLAAESARRVPPLAARPLAGRAPLTVRGGRASGARGGRHAGSPAAFDRAGAPSPARPGAAARCRASPTRAAPLRPRQRDGARRGCDRAVKPAGRSAAGASSPSSARRRPRSRYRPAPRSGSSRSRCVARRTLG